MVKTDQATSTTRSKQPVSGKALLAAILALGLIAVCPASAQSLGGRWAVTDRVMDNGEAHKMILDLKQSGDKLTGTLTTNSSTSPLTGTATGKHFELFGSRDPNKAFIVGDLDGSELHMVIRGRDTLVAKPATAADAIPQVGYIEPPSSLHKVPSNGLAATPPMGWNSWNKFAGKIDDATVRAIADAMVTSGMRDAGYIYVNVDDTWQGVRDAQGVLQPNHKFPDMKALADYVHSKGLKLGIYSSPGPRTCAGYPGSYGHEQIDAKTWAGWGIDYLKYDWCAARLVYKEKDLHPVYQKMGDALAASGRPIVFSLCEYGMGEVEKWAPEVGGNLWRTTGDIRDEWSSMIENVEKQVPAAPYAGPGRWNDPDMLEVGNGHMTDEEYRTHMSLWALAASPLLAGNDICTMSPETRAILMNREVIAVDQDTLGKQASPVKQGDLETWVKPLADGGAAVGVVNLGASPAAVTVRAGDLGLSGTVKTARDLWAHKNVALNNGAYSATVPSHGVLLLRMTLSK